MEVTDGSEDTKKLGGNIELSGFRRIDRSSMVIAKKMVGTYVRKIEERAEKLDLVKITLKPIHEREKSEKYELHALVLDNGKRYSAEATERNLFVGIDNVFKKILNEISS